ncbi:MAG: hypothetical protein R6V58_04875 [Planctomycetota bacterium]
MADQEGQGGIFTILSIATFCFVLAGIAVGAYQWHSYSAEARPGEAPVKPKGEDPVLVEGDMGPGAEGAPTETEPGEETGTGDETEGSTGTRGSAGTED